MKLGILGGGQLARMLALAAHPLGITTVCLDEKPDACAGQVTNLMVGKFDDKTLSKFLLNVDCVTIETENIPLTCLEYVEKKTLLYPSAAAVKIFQDRFYEKNFLKSLDIPVAPFCLVRSEKDLINGIERLGIPGILKTRQLGYDGKGQYVLRKKSDVSKSWQYLQSDQLILEKFISFESELSLIAVRNKKGSIAFYPLVKNKHIEGILHSSEAPFCHLALQEKAQNYAGKILDAMHYVGVLTIEFFYANGDLIVNEIAPRVHNTGHWTIEGAKTNQFENHLRVLFDLPLGSTELVANHCFLLNVIGKAMPLNSCLAIPGAHYHTYGKMPANKRKLGHITLVDHDLKRYQESKKMLTSLALKEQ